MNWAAVLLGRSADINDWTTAKFRSRADDLPTEAFCNIPNANVKPFSRLLQCFVILFLTDLSFEYEQRLLRDQ